MSRIKLQIILFLLLHSIVNAQLISQLPSAISVAPKIFNPEIIKKNKIKSINISLVDKPDGSVIIDKGATQGYEFDLAGNVTRYYYTVLNSVVTEETQTSAIIRRGKVLRPAGYRTITKYVNDTIFADLFYDFKNRIVCKRCKTGDYYDAFYFEYTEQGRINKELHCKETNISENKKVFKLGVQTVLSSETFVYTMLSATQIKKSCLNDEGREYKKGILNYDDRGNLISVSYEFIVSWMQEETKYTYNSKNQLIEKIYSGNQSGDVKSELYFEYSENGSLLSEKILKNEKLTDEINYLFDETNTLVKSEVNRDHRNTSIGIVKYEYQFY